MGVREQITHADYSLLAMRRGTVPVTHRATSSVLEVSGRGGLSGAAGGAGARSGIPLVQRDCGDERGGGMDADLCEACPWGSRWPGGVTLVCPVIVCPAAEGGYLVMAVCHEAGRPWTWTAGRTVWFSAVFRRPWPQVPVSGRPGCGW
jgi:hypothetical protein